MKSFAVIGLGRFGTQMALKLASLGEDVLAVDRREAQVEALADSVARAVVADAKNKEALVKLGVQDCDCAIVAVGSDLGTSVLITMNLKSLNVPKIICKAHDDTHREILEKLGADQIVIPEHLIADRLAASLASANVLDYIELSDDYGIVECAAPKEWVDKPLHSLHIRTRYGATVIALKNGEDIRVSPSGDEIVEKNTVLVLLGDYVSLRKIRKM